MLSYALNLSQRYGMSVVPVGADKRPTIKWGAYQKERMTESEVREMFTDSCRMGVVCGEVSGGLEVLDFDIEGFFPRWEEVLSDNGYDELLARLVVSRTPSGGFHVYYRCSNGERNQKLAQVYGEKGRPEVAIETRGEGGYVVAFPSEGYNMHRGKLSAVPTISDEDRNALVHAARILSEVADEPVSKVQAFSAAGRRPGDEFNQRADWAGILEPHGWRLVGRIGERERWCRPGKSGRHTSATTGNGHGKDLLKVFTSNAHPFEVDGVYSKFFAHALLNHAGDVSAAASSLAKDGYRDQAFSAAGQASPVQQSVSAEPSAAGAANGQLAEPSAAGAKRWKPVPYSVLRARPKKPMLFSGLLGEGDNAMIFGKPKEGKTFVVVDLLLTAVCGGTFAGVFDAARPLTVAYFTNEGLGSLHERLRACQDFNAIPFEDIESRLLVFEDVPQLYSQEGSDTFRAFADEWDGPAIDIAVIDTLNKATLGADENSNSDAAQVSKSLLYVRRKLGCSTVLVHHSNKDGSSVRGTSAYDGDLDVQLKVERMAPGASQRVLSLTFAKDLSGFEDRAFSLKPVNDSAAVAWSGTPELSSRQEAIVQIEVLMRTHPDKEWWTLGQIHDLLPELKRDTIRKACANEVTKKATEGQILDAQIDAEGTRLAVYRSRHLWRNS